MISTRLRLAPLGDDLVPGAVRVCAGSLLRAAARIGAPWLSPPRPVERIAEGMLRRFVDAEAEGRLGWVVVDPADGGVRAFAGATVTELTPDDWRFTFMPPRSVGVTASSCHAESDTAATACYPLLLDALRQARPDIPRLSVQVAPMDVAASTVWRRLGLLPDTRLARRRVDTWEPTGALPASITVRLAVPDDIEALTDLALEEHHYHAHHTATGTSPDQPRETSRRLAAEAVADTGRGRQLVAEVAGSSGTVVGSAVGSVFELDDEQVSRYLLPARYGYIGLTSVTADARGQGVGRALVDGLMRWFAEQSLEMAFLHYVVDNPLSASFWSGLGFVPHIEVFTLRG